MKYFLAHNTQSVTIDLNLTQNKRMSLINIIIYDVDHQRYWMYYPFKRYRVIHLLKDSILDEICLWCNKFPHRLGITR